MNRDIPGGAPMALSVTGATKRYASGFTLDDVTFDLPAGYIMGLIGPNGAGKSTLIKLILNAIRRDAGTIAVLGHDNIADEEAAKAQLGVVTDVTYLLESWTVRRAVKTMAAFYPTWDQALCDRYLKRFGLDARKKVKDLSRGMSMKLMLAIALSHDARLLILDEPTSGLDVLSRDELMDILRDYVADGQRSVLFSTHITADLDRAADLITYITDGRLYYTGPTEEFEDGFRLVHGGPGQEGVLGELAVGVRRSEFGFDALVRREDVGRLPEGLVIEAASIDDIIRLTNANNHDVTDSKEGN